MFDFGASSDAACPTAATAEDVCPTCSTAFSPARTNQRYCGRACQKNATRAPRTAAESPAQKRRMESRSRRLSGLSNALFETLPRYRAEFMERLIAEARGNAELRGWLTSREALGAREYQTGTGRLHIGFCLDDYCNEVRHQRSFEVLDPQGKLVSDEELAFPAEYYDPYTPPLYESGTLHKRTLAWHGRADG